MDPAFDTVMVYMVRERMRGSCITRGSVVVQADYRREDMPGDDSDSESDDD